MNLDIETTVRVIFFLLLIAAIALIVIAYRAFREAQRLSFFLKKRELLGRGWKYAFFALLVISFAVLINFYAEPVIYRTFPPSPTASLTPTITLIPTRTLTPTITLTPTASNTPLTTPLPIMPAVISQEFTASVTPNPDAQFSALQFSRSINDEYQAINPAEAFENPIDTIYGAFSYENMVIGSQWSALWFRDGELIYYETLPWNGASGGYGFTDSNIASEEWLPGTYEVQIFVGETWKQSSAFEVVGSPPTPEPTETSLATQTPTGSPAATDTLAPTDTPQRTSTPTPTPSAVFTATNTAVPTQTIIPTPTRRSTIFR